MSDVFKFVFHGSVQPKQRPRTGINKRTGRPVVYTSKETRRSERDIALLAVCAMKSQGFKKVLRGFPVVVKLWFVFHDASFKSGSCKMHTKKPDLDNLAKTVLDAFNGLVFEDDSQIASLELHKFIQRNNSGYDYFCAEVIALHNGVTQVE